MSTYDPEGWIEKDVLIVTKTYPQISRKYIETVCTGGITRDGNWIRLYPVRYRYLPYGSWYKKYQWITVKVKKLTTDPRPETYRPMEESIRLGDLISTGNNWSERRQLVLPLEIASLEDIYMLQQDIHVSMGLIKVRELLDFRMEPQTITQEPRQMSLFELLKDLEPIPYTFKYKFKCMAPDCRTHTMSIIDWEINQLYRTARQKCVGEQNIYDYIANNFVGRMFDSQKETYFYVGNHRRYPQTFMIGGVLYFNR